MVPDANPADPEMEFVLMVWGTSFGAIGWRPAGWNEDCRAMPVIEDGYSDAWPMKLDASPFKLENKKTPVMLVFSIHIILISACLYFFS